MSDLLDIIYPKKSKCISCGNEIKNNDGFGLCSFCRTSILFIKAPVCQKCGRPIMEDGACLCSECKNRVTYFDRADVVFEYSGLVQDMLHRLKYDGETDIAPIIGKLMANKLKRNGWHIDVIAPVPLHMERMKERGFNQSFLLASAIGWECGVDVSDTLLRRIRPTQSQVGLSGKQRIRNVRDAFDASEMEVKNKSVLIIDDIMTTGSTINECSRAVRKFHPKSIYCLCAACPTNEK